MSDFQNRLWRSFVIYATRWHSNDAGLVMKRLFEIEDALENPIVHLAECF